MLNVMVTRLVRQPHRVPALVKRGHAVRASYAALLTQSQYGAASSTVGTGDAQRWNQSF